MEIIMDISNTINPNLKQRFQPARGSRAHSCQKKNYPAAFSSELNQLILQVVLQLLIQLLNSYKNQEPGTGGEGTRGDDILDGGQGNDVLRGYAGNDTINGGKGDDKLFGGRGNDVLTGGEGNDTVRGGNGDDTFFIGSGSNTVVGGRGDDTAIFDGRPVDYSFSLDANSKFGVMSNEQGQTSTISEVENFKFEGVADKTYTQQELLDNKFLTKRRNISIYGDTTLNRLVVMDLESVELIQEIPVPGGQNVYSVDTVSKDKDYITPRGSNFFQVLNRNGDGRFELGKKVELDFKPRTLNRNKENGLILYSGADKPMWALIDSSTDKVVAQGGRNEVTQGTFDNYDSKWATGHAQWVSDSQFLLPDRQTHEISLYSVNKQDNGEFNVEKTSSVTLPGSVHTFFGTKKQDNGEILTFAPGEGSNAVNNSDAKLYELKIAGDQLSVEKTVNTTSGGLHHPGITPDNKFIYAPTSNGKVEVIDRSNFEVVKSLEAGKGAGHVTIIKDRNLALITNHADTFVTAVDLRNHSVIKQIPVTTDNPDVDNSLQAHTGRVSEDGKYFYNFATDQGTFFRIDLDTLTKDKSYFTGGTPKQASQPGELIK